MGNWFHALCKATPWDRTQWSVPGPEITMSPFFCIIFLIGYFPCSTNQLIFSYQRPYPAYRSILNSKINKEITFFKLGSEFFNIFEFHGVPLWGVWTVVYVDGTHVDIFLMSTGPDTFDLEIKLWKRASRDLVIKIT